MNWIEEEKNRFIGENSSLVNITNGFSEEEFVFDLPIEKEPEQVYMTIFNENEETLECQVTGFQDSKKTCKFRIKNETDGLVNVLIKIILIFREE